jgi:hypothetical protein
MIIEEWIDKEANSKKLEELFCTAFEKESNDYSY